MGTAACSAPVITRWPGSSAMPSLAEHVGQPGDDRERVAQRGRAGAGVDQLAVAGQRHPDQPGVDLGERHDPAETANAPLEARSATVSASLIRQSSNRESTISTDGARRPATARARVGDRDARALQPLAHHGDDLGLDLGLDQRLDIETVSPSR